MTDIPKNEDPEANEPEEEFDDDPQSEVQPNGPEEDDNVIKVSGMYNEWFLDYASYVILERAVPHLYDGLKPVQRRILHALNEVEDGRFHKVANVIGNTMKFHPHGDASIGDALVQIGQKELLFDTQGNWGNTLTGDRAAAARYIEVRLSKFGKEVVFNPKTTNWLLSYDGRNKEPETLPVKFPLLLAQGVEGIAVGLACKILPHNFNELIDAAIAYLRGKGKSLYPDFPFGGMADFSNYNDGLRGGKIRCRARIKKVDNKTLMIHEIPFGTTTSSLMDSIVKANDKGKIKVKKIEDNTAENAEIIVHIPTGISPDKLIDALYAFTDCEVSISPNACVIESDKPHFLGVTQMLRHSVDHTKDLLKLELEIRKGELEDQWHKSSLEKIFIEKRVYRKIEEEETWEGVLKAIDKGLKPHIKHLKREVTEDDLIRLTEIKIKRISKYDSFKADEYIKKLEEQLKEVKHHLKNLVDYAIDYFKELKKKFGKGRERRTEIKQFDNIVATKVVVANKKLYVNRSEGFIGYGLRKDEFISECSDIDDIIVFRKDGKMLVSKIDTKKFVGKDILYASVFKKKDKRTVYHMVYQDGAGGKAYVKRFNVTGVTRDKEYEMTRGTKSSRVLYFSANPNGENEVITAKLRPRPKLKSLRVDFDFSELDIKGRGVKGNILTKHLISKVELKEKGESTLAARKIWLDETVGRLNVEGRGRYLGRFKGEDRLLILRKTGTYHLVEAQLTLRFDADVTRIEKWRPEQAISAVYWDAVKERMTVKRFLAEPTAREYEIDYLTDDEDSYLVLSTTYSNPVVKIEFDKRTNDRPDEEVDLEEFIDIKGHAAIGNRLTQYKTKSITLIEQDDYDPDADNGSDDDDDPEDDGGGEVTEKESSSKKSKQTDAAKSTSTKGKKSGTPKAEAPKAKHGIKVDQSKEEAVEVELDVTPKKKGGKKEEDDGGKGQITLF